MSVANSSRRSGMTMIEVMIASAMMGVLVASALAALSYASKPAAEVSIKSYAVTQGGQTMLRLVAELEGASFADPTTAVGTLSQTGGVWTFSPDTTPGTVTFSDGSTATGYEGTAVRFDVVERYTAASGVELDLDGPFIYGFVADPNTGGLKLVRAREGDPVTGGFAPTFLTDVEAGATFRKPATSANLHIDFTVSRAVGFDQQTKTVERSRAVFHQEVNLRNLNQ